MSVLAEIYTNYTYVYSVSQTFSLINGTGDLRLTINQWWCLRSNRLFGSNMQLFTIWFA